MTLTVTDTGRDDELGNPVLAIGSTYGPSRYVIEESAPAAESFAAHLSKFAKNVKTKRPTDGNADPKEGA